MAPWYLFDSTIREVGSINVALGHSPLEAIDKRLSEEKTQIDCFNGSYIQGISNIKYQDYSKIY